MPKSSHHPKNTREKFDRKAVFEEIYQAIAPGLAVQRILARYPQYNKKKIIDIRFPGHEYTVFLLMAKRGELGRAKALVRIGADVNVKDRDGFNALHYAATHDAPEFVRFLLQNGVNPGEIGGNGSTALFAAIFNGKIDNVIEIIHFANQSRDVNLEDLLIDSNIAYHNSIQSDGKIEEFFVKLITSNHEHADEVFDILKQFNPRVISILDELYREHVGSRIVPDINAQNDSGETALHRAIDDCDAASIRRLLNDDRVDVTLATVTGLTPLHYAVLKDMSLEIINTLIKRGAVVDAKDVKRGYSALHYAASVTDNCETTRFLLQKGADPKLLNDQECTVLLEAVLNANPSHVAEIIHYAKQQGEGYLRDLLQESNLTGHTKINPGKGLEKIFWGLAESKHKYAVEALEVLAENNPAIADQILGIKLSCQIDELESNANQVGEILMTLNESENARQDVPVEEPVEKGVDRLVKLRNAIDESDTIKAVDTIYTANLIREESCLEELLAGAGLIGIESLENEKIRDFFAGLVKMDSKNDRWSKTVFEILMELNPSIEGEIVDMYVNAVNSSIKGGINEQDKNGKTHLCKAIENKNERRAWALLRNKEIDVNLACENNGFTPLHYAVLTGQGEIVKKLVEMGADIDAKDKDGEDARSFARMMGNQDIMSFLTISKLIKETEDNIKRVNEMIARFEGNEDDYMEVSYEVSPIASDQPSPIPRPAPAPEPEQPRASQTSPGLCDPCCAIS